MITYRDSIFLLQDRDVNKKVIRNVFKEKGYARYQAAGTSRLRGKFKVRGKEWIEVHADRTDENRMNIFGHLIFT